MRRTPRNIAAITAAIAAVGLTLTGPVAASAQQSPAADREVASSKSAANCNPDFTSSGVNIRSLPKTNSNVRGQGNPGDCVQVHNSTYGDTVACEDGVKNNFWYDVTNARTGARGWVSACYLPTGTSPGA